MITSPKELLCRLFEQGGGSIVAASLKRPQEVMEAQREGRLYVNELGNIFILLPPEAVKETQ